MHYAFVMLPGLAHGLAPTSNPALHTKGLCSYGHVFKLKCMVLAGPVLLFLCQSSIERCTKEPTQQQNNSDICNLGCQCNSKELPVDKHTSIECPLDQSKNNTEECCHKKNINF